MPYKLQELIDIPRLQSFIDSFSGISGIPTVIIGRSGTLIASSGWKEVCLEFHRATPEALKCCLESTDRVIGEVEKGCGITRHTCPHGFVKAAFPLVVDGEWLATMVTGQMLPGEVDQDRFRLQARRYGFDEAAYLAALHTIPVLTPEHLERNITCLQNLTDLIVEMAATARRERASSAAAKRLGERYASILATTADGFWIIDSQGRCLEANEVCAANLGYSREELLGMSLRDIDAGETDDETAARIQQIKQDGFGRFEVVHRRKDGSLMDVEVSTSYIAGEDLFITFLRDISREKRVSAVLRASEERFRSLFQSMQEGVALHELVMDDEGRPADYRILDVNPAYTAITGIDRQRAIGARGAELYGTDVPPYLQEFSRPLLTGSPYSFETYFPPMEKHFRISVFSPGKGQFATVFTDISDSKRAEEALRRSEARFRDLFEHAPVPYQSLDLSGKLLEVNDAWCRMMGYERSEAIGTGMEAYLVESARPYLQDRMSLLVRDGAMSGVTCQLQRKDGTLVDVIVEGSTGRDNEGRFERSHCILIDVTERKRAEEQLRLSQQRLQFLIGATPVVLYTCRAHGDFGATFVSDTTRSVTGYEPDEFLADTRFWLDHIHPEDRQRVVSNLACLFTHGHHSHEYRFRTREGSYRWFHDELVLVSDESGEPAEFVGCMLDVTERKQAEEALRSSQAAYQDLVASEVAGIYRIRVRRSVSWGDPEASPYTYEFMNDRFCELTGISRERHLADPTLTLRLIHPEELARWAAANEEANRSLTTFVWEGRLLIHGRLRWSYFESRPRELADGDILWSGVMLDVTDRKEAELELQRLNESLEERVRERTTELQESNRELESFCYSISHDLRAPLRAIDGCTRILQEDYEPMLGTAGKSLCSRIGSNAVRMGALIDDLLTFSRVGRAALALKRLDMTALARRAFEEMVPEGDRGRIDFRLGDLPPARADETTMGQVWVNLLGNAVKYSSREPRAVITVTGRREGKRLVYCVEDNGVGFDMAYSNKLFGVFLRAHSPKEFPGTGVGLAIVERIIHRHGGKVWAEGEEGKGATFCFSLPR
jgi:PAS domain S-box-containing protein